jgi:type III secretory pathway lipoprotein EscJ
MSEGEPADHDRRGRGPIRPATIATVPTHAEADLIVGLLASNDIDAFTSADDAGGTYPGLGFGWVRVIVDASDADRAVEVLEQTPGGAPH